MTRAAPRLRVPRAEAAVFLAGLLVHLAVAAAYRADPFFRTLIADALAYHDQAARIATRGLIGEGVFHQAPLFPTLLAVAYRVVGATARPAAGLGLQILLNSLALAVLVRVGRVYLGSTRIGVAAATTALLFGPYVFYGLKLFPVPLALLTQALALWALGVARERGGVPRAAVAGLCWGIAALARPEVLVFAPIAAVAVTGVPSRPLRRRAACAAALIGGVLVGVAPATIHNARAGDFVPVASSMGENLYAGNQPRGSGGHTAIDPRAGDLFSQRRAAQALAEGAAGAQLRPSQVSRYWRTKALAEIASAPGAWLGLEGRKLARLLHPGDPTDVYSFALERSLYLRALWALPLGPWSVLLLAACGLWIARRASTARAWPLVAFVAIHALLLLVFFVDARLRLPWLFFLTPFSGLCVIRGLDRFRSGADRAWVAAGAALLVLTIGVGYAASRPRPRDVVRLAAVLSMRQELDASMRVLAPELARSDPDPLVLDQAGWVLQKKGAWTEARDHYRAALAAGLDPNRAAQTRRRLSAILEDLGDLEGAREVRDALTAIGSDP